MNDMPLIERLRRHVDMMAPHQRERAGGALLIEALSDLERMRRALHDVAEEWAGAECGEPVHVQEAYAIGLAKRMHALAVEALTTNVARAIASLSRPQQADEI